MRLPLLCIIVVEVVARNEYFRQRLGAFDVLGLSFLQKLQVQCECLHMDNKQIP